jgi:hypothetical protein
MSDKLDNISCIVLSIGQRWRSRGVGYVDAQLSDTFDIFPEHA